MKLRVLKDFFDAEKNEQRLQGQQIEETQERADALLANINAIVAPLVELKEPVANTEPVEFYKKRVSKIITPKK